MLVLLGGVALVLVLLGGVAIVLALGVIVLLGLWLIIHGTLRLLGLQLTPRGILLVSIAATVALFAVALPHTRTVEIGIAIGAGLAWLTLRHET